MSAFIGFVIKLIWHAQCPLFLASKERFEGNAYHSRRIVALCRSIHSLLGLLALAPSLLCSPLVEIVVSGVYAVAPTRYSFSPPISRSLNPPLAAVALEQLLEAKRKPELYRDLRVRVTGYSGIFVDFCQRLQDDVIKRFE